MLYVVVGKDFFVYFLFVVDLVISGFGVVFLVIVLFFFGFIIFKLYYYKVEICLVFIY